MEHRHPRTFETQLLHRDQEVSPTEHRHPRTFETRGPVRPELNYVVPRTEALADFIRRVKLGRYIVLFAPRQTGKTTFFRTAMRTLSAAEPVYFPIQLNFERYANWPLAAFYRDFYQSVHKQIQYVCHARGSAPPEALSRFLENQRLNGHPQFTLHHFFEELGHLLAGQRVVLSLDEFDGIPRDALPGFLHTLRDIYLAREFTPPCPHSVSIVGIKSLTQLNYDRSISPFNIQDEFHLPNFTLAQVQELFGQYTAEVGQAFAPEVIKTLHRQTAGQPFLVNRLAQQLTEAPDIPKNEPIGMEHFLTAHQHLLSERNVHLTHLATNIRRNPRFQRRLMQILSKDDSIEFNLYDDVISELVTYGVIKSGRGGRCDIANPIYLSCILQAFKPTLNGLEEEYYPQDTGDGPDAYLTDTGEIDMAGWLANFREFIARAGFRILLVPQTPKEYVGQYLLFAYLDQGVRHIGGAMHLEVQTGRGRADLVIFHGGRKYIVETKLWQGEKSYQAGKRQLAAYLQSEGAAVGDYVVFDYRQTPEPRVETEQLDGVTIRCSVIPVVQEMPSARVLS